jgi:hypothetical protein
MFDVCKASASPSGRYPSCNSALYILTGLTCLENEVQTTLLRYSQFLPGFVGHIQPSQLLTLDFNHSYPSSLSTFRISQDQSIVHHHEDLDGLPRAGDAGRDCHCEELRFGSQLLRIHSQRDRYYQKDNARMEQIC